MTKNKNRDRVKRKQKDTLKTQRRLESRRSEKQTKPKPKLPEFQDLTQEQFSDASYTFWICNGINHVISNYQEGNWTPLFPEIYETGLAPEPEAIARAIMAKYEGLKEWPLEGTTALAWSVQTREMVYAYYQEVIRQMKVLSPESDSEELSRRPHNAVVWRLFNSLKAKQLTRRYRRH